MEKSEKCNYPLITDHSDWILGAIRITCPSIVRQLFWIRKLRNIEIPPSAYGLLPATNMASSSGGNEQNCSFATIIAGTSQKNNESLFFVLNGKVCKKNSTCLAKVLSDLYKSTLFTSHHHVTLRFAWMVCPLSWAHHQVQIDPSGIAPSSTSQGLCWITTLSDAVTSHDKSQWNCQLMCKSNNSSVMYLSVHGNSVYLRM